MSIRSGCLMGLFAVVFLSQSVVYSAQAITQISAEIIKPISIKATRGLIFGKILSGNRGGEVTVATDDSRSDTGSVELTSSKVSAARFEVVGHAYSTYSISLPQHTTLFDGDGNSMVVRQFQSYPTRNGQLDSNGIQEMRVGGTLQVAAEQEIGSYFGKFTVIVNYN